MKYTQAIRPSRSREAGTSTSVLCVTAIVLSMTVAACAAKRPAFYPNARTESVTSAQAQLDIDQCIAEGEAAGYQRSGARDAAIGTTTGAATGAAIGAATGAVRGHAGRGAARGAAGGAVAGLLRAMFRTREPDPIKKSYVEACLGEKGYRTIGWN